MKDFDYFRYSRSEKRFVYSQRAAATAATQLLYADNSDDEPEKLDEEDLEIILNDKENDIEETIIDPWSSEFDEMRMNNKEFWNSWHPKALKFCFF